MVGLDSVRLIELGIEITGTLVCRRTVFHLDVDTNAPSFSLVYPIRVLVSLCKFFFLILERFGSYTRNVQVWFGTTGTLVCSHTVVLEVFVEMSP